MPGREFVFYLWRMPVIKLKIGGWTTMSITFIAPWATEYSVITTDPSFSRPEN
jgi:hypothetical protein